MSRIAGQQQARKQQAAGIELTEADLAAARRREPEAVGRVYAVFAPPLFRFFMAQVGNRHTAEDLTGSVFTAAIESLPGFRGPVEALGGWLFRIARHDLFDFRRRQSRARFDPLDDVLDEAALAAGASDPEEPAALEDQLDAALDGPRGPVAAEFGPLLEAAEELRASLARLQLDPAVARRHLALALGPAAAEAAQVPRPVAAEAVPATPRRRPIFPPGRRAPARGPGRGGGARRRSRWRPRRCWLRWWSRRAGHCRASRCTRSSSPWRTPA